MPNYPGKSHRRNRAPPPITPHFARAWLWRILGRIPQAMYPKPTLVISLAACMLARCCTPSSKDSSNQTAPLPLPQAQTTSPQDSDSLEETGIFETYEHTNRVIWQKPDLVIDLLGDIEDKVVADIGAGSGFFALRLAPLSKKVIAIDIDPRFIEHLDSVRTYELPERFQPHLETRLAEPDDPKLQPGEADIILIVNTYSYFKDRVGYLRKLRNVLPEGGRILLIDFKKKRTAIGPPAPVRIPLFQAEEEVYQAGFSEVKTNDTALDFQYIIMAVK